jgi:DNA invertase Pin-like site-specific DNA recombinase
MVIGFPCISKDEQNLDLQIDSLKIAGWEKIYKEKLSGASKERPDIEKKLMYLWKTA